MLKRQACVNMIMNCARVKGVTMTINIILAIWSFAFVTSISPGPGNFLLLASGANFGFLRSLPLILGISTGFLSMVFLVGVGLGAILENNPIVYQFLRVVCGVYILWLAFKIAKSRAMSSDEQENISKPIGYFQAAMLQWVNPKAWTVALLLTVAYGSANNFLGNLLLLIGLFAIINIPSISIWALSGSALRKFLSNEKRVIIFNLIMAFLLVGSVIPMLLSINNSS